MKQLKYLVLIPMLGAMLMYSSCTNDDQVIDNEVIQSDNILTKGFYSKTTDGRVLFTGTSLRGQVVPYADYTNDEKETFDRYQKISDEKENSRLFEFKIVIDENSDRVLFLKMGNITIKKQTNTYGEYQVEEYTEDVPYAIVENVPVYPGCDGGTKEEQKACLNKELQKHVARKFNADLAKDLGLSPGKKRIYVSFKITKTGTIEIIGARAPHPDLEEEAKRVVRLLPKMTPGKQRGEPVNVTYMLPISFVVE